MDKQINHEFVLTPSNKIAVVYGQLLTVHITLGDSGQKELVCEVPAPHFSPTLNAGPPSLPNAFFGLTSFSGLSPKPLELGAEVSVRRIKMMSHDLHAAETSTMKNWAEVDDLVGDSQRVYETDADQISALHKLERLMHKYIEVLTEAQVRKTNHHVSM